MARNKSNELKNECFVINCECPCRNCKMYKAYLKYLRNYGYLRSDIDAERCMADCLEYTGE